MQARDGRRGGRLELVQSRSEGADGEDYCNLVASK
jgi:hypothetical protein